MTLPPMPIQLWHACIRFQFSRGDSVHFSMRLRLSMMMFLEYFIWGAWYVTLGTWLGRQLHFSGEEIGLAAGTTALGAVVSPFLVGLMADELFANQRLLAAVHGIGGIFLSVSFPPKKVGPLDAGFLIYSLFFMPALGVRRAHASTPVTSLHPNPAS